MVKTTEFNVQTQMNYVVGNMSGFTAAYTGMNNLSALLSSIMTSYTTLAGTGRAAYMTLGASVAAFGLKSAEAFGEYQRGMNMVKAISNNTNAQMQMLAKSAGEFSSQFRMGIEDINSGLVTLGRAGLTDVNNQIEVLKNGLQVAKISGMDLASTLEDIVTTTSLLGGDIKSNTFGAETKEVSNLLVATSLSGPLNVSDVIETLKFAGGSAAAAGATLSNEEGLHDLLGTIGAFSQKGVTGSIAGTALRAFITKPASQDQKVSDALAKLGLDAYSLWEKDPEQGWHMKPIAEQIGMITKAMNDNHLTNLDRIEVWGDIVGNKMGQQMLKLDENRIKETTKDIEHQRNLENIYQGTLTTFASQVERLNQIFQAIYRNIGSGFASSLTGIVEGVANILEFINNLGNGVLFKLIAPILGPLGLYGLAKGLTDFVHVLQALRENIAISANTPLEDQDIWQTANGVVAKRYRQAWYDEEKRKRMEDQGGRGPDDEYYRKRREQQEKDYQENQEYYRQRREQQAKDYQENKQYQTMRRDRAEQDYQRNQEYYMMRQQRAEDDYHKNQEIYEQRRIQQDKDYQENRAYYEKRRERQEKDYQESQQYYNEKRERDREYHQARMAKMLNLDKITLGTQFAEIIAQSVVLNGNISSGTGDKSTTILTDNFIKTGNQAQRVGEQFEEARKKIDSNITLSTLGESTATPMPLVHDGMLFNKQDLNYGIRFESQNIVDALMGSSAGRSAINTLSVLETASKIGNFTGSLMNEGNIDRIITKNGVLSDSLGIDLHSDAQKYISTVADSVGLSRTMVSEAFRLAYNNMIKNYKKTGSYDKYFGTPDDVQKIYAKKEAGGELSQNERNRLRSYQPKIRSEATDSYGNIYDPRHDLLSDLTRQALHNVLGTAFNDSLRRDLSDAVYLDRTTFREMEADGRRGTAVQKAFKSIKLDSDGLFKGNILDLLSPLMSTGAYDRLTEDMSHKNALQAKDRFGKDEYKKTKDAISFSMRNRGFIDHLDIASQTPSISEMGMNAFSRLSKDSFHDFKLSFKEVPIEIETEIKRMGDTFTKQGGYVTPKVKKFGRNVINALLRDTFQIRSPGIMARTLGIEVGRFGQIFIDKASEIASRAAEMGQQIVVKFQESIKSLPNSLNLDTILSAEFTRVATVINESAIKLEELMFQLGSKIQAAYKRAMGIASPGFIFYATDGELTLVKQLFKEMSSEISGESDRLGKKTVDAYRIRAQDLGLAAEQANHIAANINAGFKNINQVRKLQIADVPIGTKFLTDDMLKTATALPYYQINNLNRKVKKQDVQYEGRLRLPGNLQGLDFETTGVTFGYNGQNAYRNDRMLSWGLTKLIKSPLLPGGLRLFDMILPPRTRQMLSDADGLESTSTSALVHKISSEAQENAVSAETAWTRLSRAIGTGSKNLVAFNAVFEANVIRSAINRGVLSKDFIQDMKIYDPSLMWRDWIKKTNGKQILSNLGSNVMNSLGLLIPNHNGQKDFKLLDNTLDTVNRFFGRKAETHIAGDDALDGIMAMRNLFSLQGGVGNTSLLKSAKQILWSKFLDKELDQEKDLTRRDKIRKSGGFVDRGLSELEILALTSRNDMGEMLNTNDNVKITQELYKRAEQLNKEANLGFSSQALKNVLNGKPLIFVDENQREIFDKLTKLQQLNLKNRFMRNDLINFLINDDLSLDINQQIKNNMRKANLRPSYNNNYVPKEQNILKSGNTLSDPRPAVPFSDTSYGNILQDQLTIMRNHFDLVRKGHRFNYENDESTLNEVRSAIHSLSRFTGLDSSSKEELLKYTYGIDRVSEMFGNMNSVMGLNLTHRKSSFVDNRLDDLESKLTRNALIEIGHRDKNKALGALNSSDERRLLLDALFKDQGMKVAKTNSVAVQMLLDAWIGTNASMGLSDAASDVNKNRYYSPNFAAVPEANPNKEGLVNSTFRGEEGDLEEVISSNPYLGTPAKNLIPLLNDVDENFTYDLKNGILEIYEKNTDVSQKELKQRLATMEKNFTENTQGLNAFWRTSDVNERSFHTIKDVPRYMSTVEEYEHRFGKYTIPDKFTNFEQIANKINNSPKELRQALADTGALQVDAETTLGKNHIYDRIDSLVNSVNVIKQKTMSTHGKTKLEEALVDQKLSHDHAPWQKAEMNRLNNYDAEAKVDRLTTLMTLKGRNDFLQDIANKYQPIYQQRLNDAGGSERRMRSRARREGLFDEYVKDMKKTVEAVGLELDELIVKVGETEVPLANSFELLGKTSIKAFRAGLEMNSPPKAFTELITYLRETEENASGSIVKLQGLMRTLRRDLAQMPKGTKFEISAAEMDLLHSQKVFGKSVLSMDPGLNTALLEHRTKPSRINNQVNLNRIRNRSHDPLDRPTDPSWYSRYNLPSEARINQSIQRNHQQATNLASQVATNAAMGAQRLITIKNQLDTEAMLGFANTIKQANVTFKTGSEEWITQLMRTAGVKAEELMTEEEFTAALLDLMMQLRSGKITKNEFGTKASELVSGQENIQYVIDREKALDRKVDRMTQGGLTGKGWQVAYGLGGVGGKIGKGITGALSGAMSFMMNPVVMGAQMIWGYIQQGIEMWKQMEAEEIAKLSEIASNAESSYEEQTSKWEEAQSKENEKFGDLSDNEKQDQMLEAIQKAREDNNSANAETKALLGKQNALISSSDNMINAKMNQRLTGYNGIQANWEELMQGSGMVGSKDEFGLMDYLEGLVNPDKFKNDSNTARIQAMADATIQIDTRVKNMEEMTEDYQKVMASFGVAGRSMLDIYNVRGILSDDFFSGTFFDPNSSQRIGAPGFRSAEQLASLMKKEEKILQRFENRYLRFTRSTTGQGDRITVTLGEGSIHDLANQLGVKDVEAAQMLAVHELQRIQDVMLNQVEPQLAQTAISMYQGAYSLEQNKNLNDIQAAFQNTMTQGIFAIQSQVAQLVYKATMEQALADYQAATGDTETDTIGLLLNRARDTSYEHHDAAKQYASQGWGGFMQARDLNHLVNQGYTQEQAMNKLLEQGKDSEYYKKLYGEQLGKYEYNSEDGKLGKALIQSTFGPLLGREINEYLDFNNNKYDDFTKYTDWMMKSYAENVPLDEAIKTLNDAQVAADEEGDNGKDTDDSDANKQRYVQLAICNKKAIPKLNVNLFKKAPTFTVLNKNFKLRDIKINTADKAKNIENSLKNAIIDVQERSDPKIIQDSEAEYDPVGATDDATNLPTGASLTK